MRKDCSAGAKNREVPGGLFAFGEVEWRHVGRGWGWGQNEVTRGCG